MYYWLTYIMAFFTFLDNFKILFIMGFNINGLYLHPKLLKFMNNKKNYL